MASGSKAVAWGIAILAAAAVGVVLVKSGREKEALEARLAEAEAAGRSSPEEMERAPATRPTEPAPVPVAPPATPVGDLTTDVAPGVDPVEDPAEENDDKKRRKAQQERVVDAQMTLMMNIAYGPLFDELGLGATKREEALTLMVDVTRGVRKAAEKAMRNKDTTAAEMKAMEDAADAELREELEALLSPAELAAWDEYQEYSDQIMFAQLLDGQLTMLSPGLDPAGREVVKEVFAEELALHIEAFGETDTVYSLDAFNQVQLDALLAGLDRVNDSLDSDQYGHAVGFVKQVEAVFSAMAEQ